MSDFSENERNGAPLPSEERDATVPPISAEETTTTEEDSVTEEATAAQGAERIVYRWNYDEQCAHDAQKRSRASKRNVILFASVMAGTLLLCVALLIGVIYWANIGVTGGVAYASNDIGSVARAIKPSVVLIEATRPQSSGEGTGFFISENGYIATNYHVVEGASEIKVTLYSGKSLSATLVGYYALDDLAVIKIEGAGYPVLRVGNSDTALTGDRVVAVGNPAGADASWSVTEGIISADTRRVLVSDGERVAALKMLQTDAHVNPGNSGGPLCNLRGEVIGVITQKLSGYEGIGFAIPINEAMHTLTAILEGEMESFTSTASQVRPTIGVLLESIKKGESYHVDGDSYVAVCDGLLISSVIEGSGADAAKLLYGDLICEIDGVAVGSMQELQVVLFSKRVGDTVTLKIWRGTAQMEIHVKLS